MKPRRVIWNRRCELVRAALLCLGMGLVVFMSGDPRVNAATPEPEMSTIDGQLAPLSLIVEASEGDDGDVIWVGDIDEEN